MKSPQTLRVCLRSLALIAILSSSARYAAAATETLFTTQVPQIVNVSDGPTTNRELGIRFTSGVAGRITAIRFWKASRENRFARRSFMECIGPTISPRSVL